MKRTGETGKSGIASNIRLSVILAAAAAAVAPVKSSAAMSADTGLRQAVGNSYPSIAVPKLSQHGEIDLSAVEETSNVTVMSMAYSPDDNYLAIVDVTRGAATHITVWNLKTKKLQSHTDRLHTDFGIYPDAVLSWTPDGKYITFGYGGKKNPIQFWDPITGSIVKTAAPGVVATSLQFNKQGTKAVASPGVGGSSKFRIYDTVTWSYTEFDEGQLYVQDVAWASDDKVVAVGYWHTRVGEEGGGTNSKGGGDEQAIKLNDVVARLIDPSGHLEDHTKVLIPSLPKTVGSSNREVTYNQSQAPSAPFLVSDADGTVMALGLGNVLNGRTLDMLTYATNKDIVGHKVPLAVQPRNVAISPDGNYLYLKGSALDNSSEGARNLIVDTRTGKQVLWFRGGSDGIAIRPDGKQLAVGDGQSVKLWDIE